jgi:NitT/TauT family transport system substrate-binding protein
MPFKEGSSPRLPVSWRIAGTAAGWFVLISVLHYMLNVESGGSRIIRMGYMPVITNLAAPILDRVTRGSPNLRFEALKFSSFAEMAEALRNDYIQAAFIIAPLAIVLRHQEEDVKIVYIGNRHESTLVARKSLNAKNIACLAGKTIAVPMRYSGHNLSLLQVLEKYSLSGQVRVVEINPPDMAAALASGALDAYYVGEPFAAQTLMSGDASLVNYVEELWPDFICNLMVVKQHFIETEPDVVRYLVEGAARSGFWAKNNTRSAAALASEYWNQPIELVEYALTHPPNRIRYDQFIPQYHEIQKMADLMLHFGLTQTSDITGLIDDRFARQADVTGVSGIESILRPSEAGR